MLKYIAVFFSAILPFTGVSQGEELQSSLESRLLNTLKAPAIINERKEIKALELTEWVFSNGIRVIYKYNAHGDNETLLQMFAPGGYSQLSTSERAAVSVGAGMVLYSGIGKISGSELTYLSNYYGVDFVAELDPFQRIVKGESEGDALPYLLAAIHHLFTSPQFNIESLPVVKRQIQQGLARIQEDCEAVFEAGYLQHNSSNSSCFQQLSHHSLNSVHAKSAEHAFRSAFCEGGPFTCVLVGSYPVSEVEPYILTFLGTIPSSSSSWNQVAIPDTMPFPKGITKKIIRCNSDQEGLTRISFPLTWNINPQENTLLEFGSQCIEKRLREKIRKQLGTTQGLDVGYMFPAFPHRHPGWLWLQFRTTSRQAQQTAQLALDELKQLQAEGPTEDELRAVKLLLKRSNEFWSHENSFWVQILTNFTNWGWDPMLIIQGQDELETMTTDQARLFLLEAYDINTYSIIRHHPG